MTVWLSSINAFRYFRLAFLLLGLGAGMSSAVAEDAQPAPKTTAPPPGTPAAPTAKTDAPACKAWVKVCTKSEKTGNKQACLVKYEAVNSDTGQVLVTVSVRGVEGQDPALLVGVTTAFSLIIPIGVQVKIDDGEPISLRYVLCLPPICQAETKLTKEMYDKLRSGTKMMVAAMNAQQKTMGFRVSLAGFGAAYDGPAVDSANYAESQRQMELARQIVEQKREEQSGEAPPDSSSVQKTNPTPSTAPTP